MPITQTRIDAAKTASTNVNNAIKSLDVKATTAEDLGRLNTLVTTLSNAVTDLKR